MPLPVMHLRNKQTIVKTVNAPNCHCEERSDVAISGRQLQFVQGVDKMHGPIASVAALTAQPLAALPPYGCGVPLAGCERLGQLQISGYSADRTDFQICHCDAPKGPWQSRAGSYDFADGFPVIRPSTARLPRRFAPRNDNPSAFTVLLTTCFLHRCSAGRGMPRTHNAPSMSRLFFAIDFRA